MAEGTVSLLSENEMVMAFIEIAQCGPKLARRHLTANHFQLELALDRYYEEMSQFGIPESDDEEDVGKVVICEIFEESLAQSPPRESLGEPDEDSSGAKTYEIGEEEINSPGVLRTNDIIEEAMGDLNISSGLENQKEDEKEEVDDGEEEKPLYKSA